MGCRIPPAGGRHFWHGRPRQAPCEGSRGRGPEIPDLIVTEALLPQDRVTFVEASGSTLRPLMHPAPSAGTGTVERDFSIHTPWTTHGCSPNRSGQTPKALVL